MRKDVIAVALTLGVVGGFVGAALPAGAANPPPLTVMLERVSGNTLKLTVTNTASTPVSDLQFALKAAGYDIVAASVSASPDQHCSAHTATSFECSLGVPANSTLTITFDTDSAYPDNGGGTIASTDQNDSPYDSLDVTGPAGTTSGGGGSGGTTTTTTTPPTTTTSTGGCAHPCADLVVVKIVSWQDNSAPPLDGPDWAKLEIDAVAARVTVTNRGPDTGSGHVVLVIPGARSTDARVIAGVDDYRLFTGNDGVSVPLELAPGQTAVLRVFTVGETPDHTYAPSAVYNPDEGVTDPIPSNNGPLLVTLHLAHAKFSLWGPKVIEGDGPQTATQPRAAGGAARVQVAILRVAKGAQAAAARCAFRTASGGFRNVPKVAGRCYPTPATWLTARGVAKWHLALKPALRRGSYVAYARVVGGGYAPNFAFTAKGGDRRTLNVK